jgi:hypothetical protein
VSLSWSMLKLPGQLARSTLCMHPSRGLEGSVSWKLSDGQPHTGAVLGEGQRRRGAWHGGGDGVALVEGMKRARLSVRRRRRRGCGGP